MFRRKPSPSMVVALVALFVALGGSSYAALRIGSTPDPQQLDQEHRRQEPLAQGRRRRQRHDHRRQARGQLRRRQQDRRQRGQGREVDEATLGPVPNARTNATNAANATNATNAVTATNAATRTRSTRSTRRRSSSRTRRSVSACVRLVDGETKQLGTFGRSRSPATCEHDGAGNELAAPDHHLLAGQLGAERRRHRGGLRRRGDFEFVQAAPHRGDAADRLRRRRDRDRARRHDRRRLDVFAGVDVLDGDCVVGGTLRLG